MDCPSPATRAFLAPLLLALLAPFAAAQTEELDELRASTVKKATNALASFARRATSNKLPSRARVAWREIVDHYEPDHRPARLALGFVERDGAWQRETPESELDGDSADARKRATVEKAWTSTVETLAGLHRDLGRALKDAGFADEAVIEFDRVLAFAPDDEEAHVAVGHEAHEGFYGTEEEIAFLRRFAEIRAKAREIAAREFEVAAVPADEMPAELKATGLPFAGARSKHFTHWTIDGQDDALASVQWAERGYELLGELLGDRARFRKPKAMLWIAVVRTDEQRRTVFEKSPRTLGRFDLSQALMFSGTNFAVDGGSAGLYRHDKAVDADHSVALVTKTHFLGGRNPGFGEGLVHAMTWLLCGTTLTRFADLPKTVSGDHEPLGADPAAWRKRLEREIENGEDWPLVHLPRERYDNFREGARIKAWSFALFALANYPRRWYDLLEDLSGDLESPEDVDAAFVEAVELPVAEVEQRWRRWARPGSRLGKASGW